MAIVKRSALEFYGLLVTFAAVVYVIRYLAVWYVLPWLGLED